MAILQLQGFVRSQDERLPVYERIKFLSIYSSNLEEFYKIRVSGYHSSLLENINRDEPVEEALKTIVEINNEVKAQEKEYHLIFNDMILPELKEAGLCCTRPIKWSLSTVRMLKNISMRRFSLTCNP